jgi:predicted Zn-dependent protease
VLLSLIGRFRKWPLALLLTLTLLWPCPPALALTYEQERELGKQVLEMVKKRSKLVEDPVINAYLNDLGQKIVKAAGPQPFDYRFYIVDNAVVNAFASPGGYVFVHSGLVNALASEGQLASVLSHEIAHVTHRHISDLISKSKTVTVATMAGILVGALVGGPAGSALILGSMGAGIQAQLSYTREDEREADITGLDYLVAAGYDPRFAAESFDVLLRSTWHAPKDVPTYLTTHPGLSERVASVANLVATTPAYNQMRGRGDDKSFQSAKNRLLALTADPQHARNHFETELQKNPQDPWGHYGLGMLHQKEQNLEGAIREFRLALELDPSNASIMLDLGYVLMQKKDFREAMNVLTPAVVLRPRNSRALFLLGRTYEELDVADRALQLYERAAVQAPDNPDILSRLGMAYGRRGDLVKAHLNTGLAFLRQDQTEKALYHLRLARDKSGVVSPDLKRKIDNALAEAEALDTKARLKKDDIL